MLAVPSESFARRSSPRAITFRPSVEVRVFPFWPLDFHGSGTARAVAFLLAPVVIFVSMRAAGYSYERLTSRCAWTPAAAAVASVAVLCALVSSILWLAAVAFLPKRAVGRPDGKVD